MSRKQLSRRDLVKKAALAGAAVGSSASLYGAAYGSGASSGSSSPSQFGRHLIQKEHEGKEKHVPVITAPEKVKGGERFDVEVEVGKEKHHPNTVVHHIKWIQLFAKESDDTPMVHVATYDMGPTYAEPRVIFPVMLERTATLHVLAYCNLHGVWENSTKVEV